jgi:outer membrane protein assembly factor BamA
MFKALRKKIFFLAFIQSLFLQLGYAQVTDTSFTVDSIHIAGNRKTKDQIILRELSFNKGDTIHNWSYHQAQSRKQLINLFLFNEIALRKLGNTIHIDVTERWYIWPIPELDYADRNFNQWWLSKDPKRLIYGINLEWYNLMGRNQTLTLNLINGYTKMAGVNYKVPYINKKQTWGMQFVAQYSSNKEIWFKTANDKVQFFRDQDREMIRRSNAEISFTHRPKIFSYLSFYGGYRYWKVADTVMKPQVNPYFLPFNKLGQIEFYTGLNFVFDKRDFKGFPLNGHLLKLNFEWADFPVAEFPSSNFKGKETKMFKLNYSFYKRLSNKFYISSNAIARLYSYSFPKYFKAQALGYGKDYIRGYELNVIDGSHFLLGKAEMKYRFLNRKYKFMPKLKNYEQLPLTLFLSTYFDMGYVVNNYLKLSGSTDQNVLPNTWQNGKGLGLNVVAFYDYCMRLEYSFDKYMNSRFYVSFVAAM